MPRQSLKQNLEQLRQKLEHAHDLDSATQRELADIAETIEELLAQESPDVSSTYSRINDAALEFEARHPTFARILSEITDTLTKLGV